MSLIVIQPSTPASVVVQFNDYTISIDAYGASLPPLPAPIFTAAGNTTIPANFITGAVYVVTALATMSLPSAIGNGGKKITIKMASNSYVTIQAYGSETIDGSNTAQMHRKYEALTLVSDNTNWQVIA